MTSKQLVYFHRVCAIAMFICILGMSGCFIKDDSIGAYLSACFFAVIMICISKFVAFFTIAHANRVLKAGEWTCINWF